MWGGAPCLKCSERQGEQPEGPGPDEEMKERRGLRAGRGGSLEGILSVSLQAVNAGPTQGNREAKALFKL